MDKFDDMLAKWQPIALSLFRFVTGLLLFHYGTAKMLGFPVVPMFAKIPPLIQVAGTIELVLGALLMIGLFTRIVAFVLAGEMAFAYFIGHMFKDAAKPVFYPAAQRRLGRDPVLLRLPLSRDVRRRAVQRRCDDAEEVILTGTLPT